MRVEFNWMRGHQSILQQDDHAIIKISDLMPGSSFVYVMGEQVWPPISQEEQVEGTELVAAVPFPIGMRVQVTGNIGEGPPNFSFGQVVEVKENTRGIEWEGWNGGHTCSGNAASGQGYYVRPENLVAAPLPQTTPTYPDCETECAECGTPLGLCIDAGERHSDLCLDTMWEGVDGQFYHDSCQPEAEEEEETPPPAFQIGDVVHITRDVGALARGLCGTVRTIELNGYGVEILGIGNMGQTLGGVLLTYQGWYCTTDMLERR